MVLWCSRYNQSATVGSVHKFSEKEKAMRVIGCRLSIVVPGTALGVLAREAIADDAACHTHSKRGGRRPAGDLYSVEAKTADERAPQSISH